jgi:hypothetical protein
MSDLDKPSFRWSFSQWETYNQCPQKWNFQSRLRLPRKPAGPAAARGLEMHDTVEQYIKGADLAVLHKDINRKYIPVLDAYRNHPNGDRYTEKKLAIDNEWYVCGPQDKRAACVAVLDAVRFTKPQGKHAPERGVLEIGEWKSGKPKDTHADQRKLYAMFGMRAWLADEVRVTTYYLEHTAVPQRTVLASESGFEKLKDLWGGRIRTMQRDELCAPRPGFYCRFCDYAKAQGGPCQFGA